MTKAVLDGTLKRGEIPRLCLFYGDSEFMLSFYGDVITQRLGSTHESMYFEEYDFENLIDFLGSSSLFSTQNIMRLKLYVVPNKKQSSQILQTLKDNANSYLIIELYKSPSINNAEYAKRFKGLSANFKDNSLNIADVRFYNPNQNEAMAILDSRAKMLGINASYGILQYLLEIQNYDLGMAYNELEKFIYYKEITKELLEEISHTLGSTKIESLIDCIFNKRGNLAYMVQSLSDEGIDEVEILREIHRYFYILFKLYGHSKAYGKIDSKEALGYVAPSHILNTWSKRSLKISTKQYLDIFEILNLARIKRLNGDDSLLSCAIAMQRIL